MTVHLITSLSGFPNGTANAKRITLLGKTFQESGIEFKIYTNDIQHNKLNTEVKGIYQGLSFQYVHGKRMKEDAGLLNKIMCFLVGMLKLFSLFWRWDSKKDLVYSYNHGSMFNLYIIILCKLFRIKVIQEINEWYHNDLNRSFEKYVIEGPLVKFSNGAVVISSEIEQKVKEINPRISVFKIPVLEELATVPLEIVPILDEKYCFWMGDVNGYLKDVLFIVEAVAKLYKAGVDLNFFISGPYHLETLEKIEKFAEQLGLPFDKINLLGFLSEDQLNQHCRNAFFYVVPLWNDERSKARFPTKIATFAKSGRPIISCDIGEVGQLFTDSENILFYNEGDNNDLAMKMKKLMQNIDLHSRLSANVHALFLNKFNYLSYSGQLNLFAYNLISEKNFLT